MYDLRYPRYVEKLQEGTEGMSDEEALRKSLHAMFSGMDDDSIKLLYFLLGDPEEFDEAEEEWDSSCDAVENFIEYFEEENRWPIEPTTPADFLDRLAAIMMEEFDAYAVRIPIPDDLV